MECMADRQMNFLKKPGCGQGSCRKEEVDLHISMDLSAILHWSQLYHDAISLAVRLICEYRENGAADSEYQHTFGVE